MEAVLEVPEVRVSPGKVTVVEYTDPYSIWCWGCEPSVRRLEVLYPETVDVEVRMGGLFEDFGPMRAYWSRMSGGQWKESVRAFMNAVAAQHRMPMDPERMLGSIEEFDSTWPACIAVNAAELQGQDEGRRYLRRLREATLVEGRAIHRPEVQAEVASEAGLDASRLDRALTDGSAEAAFRADLEECRTLEITGFPTFEVRSRYVSLRIEGWHPWEVFEETLRKIDPDIRPRRVEPSKSAVRDLLGRYPRCATREVAGVLGITDDDAEILLEELEARAEVRRREAGTGLFWETSGRGTRKAEVGRTDGPAPRHGT